MEWYLDLVWNALALVGLAEILSALAPRRGADCLSDDWPPPWIGDEDEDR